MDMKFEKCSNCGKLRWCASSLFAPPLCGEGECNPFLMIGTRQSQPIVKDEK